MNIKKTRICARKGCNSEFRLHKTTDKFCCYACYLADLKEKDQKKTKVVARKTIKQFSDKRMIENRKYAKLRKEFLSKKENGLCPVAKKVFKIDVKATEIHHKAGRVGKLLNDTTKWLAVSRVGHCWVHQNPEKARKIGFLLSSSSN